MAVGKHLNVIQFGKQKRTPTIRNIANLGLYAPDQSFQSKMSIMVYFQGKAAARPIKGL